MDGSESTVIEALESLLGSARPGDPIDDARLLAATEAALLGTPQRLPQVSRYRIGVRLGEGGFGIVHAAFDPELEREVAIKLLHPSEAEDAEAKIGRLRMLREARALARLSHRNAVVVHDVGTYELNVPGREGEQELRGVFIVMERIDGPTLGEWLKAPGRTQAEILDVFIGAGRGLAAAHAAGLVHRDFKAENVLIDSDGQPRVVDFGLARPPDEVASARRSGAQGIYVDSQMAGGVTMAGFVVGTPSHMAPEQLTAGSVDARADQYAFCVALYRALVGTLPFAGDTIDALLVAKRAGPDTEALRRRVPLALARALERGLQADQKRRYADMDGLLAAVSRGARRPSKLPWLAAAALLTGAVAVTVWPREAPIDVPIEAPCADADAALGDAWGPETAARVKARFLANDPAAGAAAWSRIEPTLQDWADAWSVTRRDACEATMVTHSAPPELMGSRMLCLDRGLRSFVGVLRVLDSIDGPALQYGPEIVAQLPVPAVCIDDSPRPSAAGTTVDRDRVLALEEQLAVAHAHDAAGHEGLARAAYDRVIEQAALAAVPQLEARALIGRSSIDREVAEGERTAWRALEVAESTDDEALSLQAAIAVIEALWNRRKLDEADRMAQITGARLRRRGIDDDLPARFAAALGSVRFAQARFVESALLLREALDRFAVWHGADNLAQSDILTVLGHVEIESSHLQAAFVAYTQAQEIRAARLDPDHRLIARGLNNLGRVERALGRYADSARDLDAASASALRRGADPAGLELSIYTLNRAMLMMELGAPGDAVVLLQRVYDGREKLLGPDHERTARAGETLAKALAMSGDGVRARDYARRALTVRQGIYAAGHNELVRAETTLAQAERVAGDPTAALAHADAALAHAAVLLGRESLDTAATLLERALALAALGRRAEALLDARAALAAFKACWPAAHPRLAPLLAELARLESPETAVVLRQDALARLLAAGLVDHPLVAILQQELREQGS